MKAIKTSQKHNIDTKKKRSENLLMRNHRVFYFEHWQIISFLLMIYDAFSIAASYFFGLWLRYDFKINDISQYYIDSYKDNILILIVFTIIIFWLLKLYKTIWRFVNYNDLFKIVIGTSIAGIVHFISTKLFSIRMPISYYIVGYLLSTIFAIVGRFSYRLYLNLKKNNNKDFKRVMLIGAGDAGMQIINELNKSDKVDKRIVCIIDDNSNKHGRYIEGIPVVGGRDDILFNVKEYKIDIIYFAIPTADTKQKREILHICEESGCEIKVLPGLYQLVNGEVSTSIMKDVAIEDLLGRDTIKVNNDDIFEYIQNKVVLVTGGGGSIGSELCRQIAAHNPRELIIFDIYENNAYDIQQELRRKYKGSLNLKVLIGSVRDSKRVDDIFNKYRPEIVYHAAAHKHVPLMEESPCEAIKNNVIGTFKTAYAAIKYGTKRFVLISTDKAVNSTNVMGASKRMCEMVIQTFDKLNKNYETDKLALVEDCFKCSSSTKLINKTEFVAVRFGNVLGSNGSVIPLFKKQIEEGGPVTVTHPDIIRYFMTVSEAVSLVLQAGAYAKGGEIFILDMGEPVKIDTLARNLIKLSGFKPDEDIKIVYSGLRPGEKLYEEKLMAEEGTQKTDNDLIHVGRPLDIDVDKFIKQLKKIYELSMNNLEDETIECIKETVSTYRRGN